jgi:hypothetical protein
MRQDYGFTPGGPSWRAPLGQGAMAMMGQAALPFAGQQDPQVTGALKSAGFGDVNLGSTPFEVSQNLGQQFRDPYHQLTRNQTFATTLLNQWKPPDLRLTGEDLLNVAMQQQAQNAQAQQAAFEQALQGSTFASQSAANASAAQTAAIGSIGAGAIRGISNYYNPSSTPWTLGSYAGAPGTSAGAMDLYNPNYNYGGGGSSFGGKFGGG